MYVDDVLKAIRDKKKEVKLCHIFHDSYIYKLDERNEILISKMIYNKCGAKVTRQRFFIPS